MTPHRARPAARPRSLGAVLLLAAACADAPVGTTREAALRPGLTLIGDGIPTTVVNAATPGYYNQAIGNLLNGTSAAFPNAGTDPVLSFPSAPSLAPAAGVLGGWLSAAPLPLNANWSGPAAVPAGWAVNTETAIVYELRLEAAGCVRLTGHFGVDNGIFVWRDGEYRFGAMAPGGVGVFEYPNVDLGTVAPGTHYVQVLREDHGGATGYAVRIDAVASNRPPVPVPGGPYSVAQAALVTLDGSGSFDPDAACGDAVVAHAWDLDASIDFERPGASVTTSYLEPGTYHPRLRVVDRFGRPDSATATVVVANVAPRVSRLKLDPNILNRPRPNQPFPVSFVFTDPSPTDGPWPWRIDFGDGTVRTGAADARGQLDFTHTYAAPGSLTLRFTVGDRHGGTSTRTIPVEVQ